MREAFVYEAVRTPRGRVRKDGGTLAGVPAYELFAGLLTELTARGVPADAVQDVIAGVSTVHGEQAADVPRMAVMAAGWPDTVPGGMVSRMCTSGLDVALAAGAAQVKSGMADVVVAGGAESMSRVPMFSDRPAFALDESLGELTGFVTIGVSADLTAARHGFLPIQELDAWAVRVASALGHAAPAPGESVVPVRRDGVMLLDRDEARPRGHDHGIAGWAAAAVRRRSAVGAGRAALPRVHPPARGPAHRGHRAAAVRRRLGGAHRRAGGAVGARPGDPIGRIASWAYTAVRSPGLDGTVDAARLALKRAGIAAADVDVAEFNESFAVTPLLLIRELGLDQERVNVHGGAVAVGHPLGASGGILLASALEQLSRGGGRYGLLVIPAALGVSMALVVERLG